MKGTNEKQPDAKDRGTNEKQPDAKDRATNEKQSEAKESSSTPSAKTKKKSRFDCEGDQNTNKRKDERCDMFAENDTFGSNVNVSTVELVLIYLVQILFSCGQVFEVEEPTNVILQLNPSRFDNFE